MTAHTARSEDVAQYLAAPADLAGDDAIIERAMTILASRMGRPGAAMISPTLAKNYLTLSLGVLEHEVFAVLFLDVHHRLIAIEEMLRGTLTQTSVYPREVVKRALALNAAAVILAHNHPSGVAEPSQADRMLTDALKSALALVDVRVVDHFIVAGMAVKSFAENGWL